MDSDHPLDITLAQFTAAFVLFGAVLAWALLQPELGPSLDLGRTKLSIWATTILLIPALALYPFRGVARPIANLSHLFWTFAWVAFLVHSYWAIFKIFGGVESTFREMGNFIAGVNFVLLGLWTLDVLMLWLVRHPSGWLGKMRLGTRVFVFLVFAVTLVGLRGGNVRILGIAFIGVVLVALILRGWSHVRAST